MYETIQEMILNECRVGKVRVTVFTTNGFQMNGFITMYDNYVVVIDSDGKQQMVYKHAISTIVPSKAV